MNELFRNVLTASFHGSIVIAVVLLLRPLLRKAPRKFVCLLWLMVGLRLLVPLEISSTLSLQPAPQPQILAEAPGYLGAFGDPVPDELRGDAPAPQTPVVTPPDRQAADIPEMPVSAPKVKKTVDWKAVIPMVWLTVTIGIGLYSVAAYISLRIRIREAIRIREGIWESDRIETAFILGYIRPRIYLPINLSRSNRRHILAHERTHLEKGDHWFKLIGFLALAVHWFNPLVWIAYILLCKDIEMACDERVVQFMELEERKSYSAALLACSAGRAHFAACPVAFGEVSVKERIRRVLRYRKPSFWISLTAVAALAFVGVCFLTSPEKTEDIPPETTGVVETTEAGETRPQVEADPAHDLSDLPEDRRQEDYTDPNGLGLRLYAFGANPTGVRWGFSFQEEVDYDDREKLGRAMTFSEEYWLEREVNGSWEKLEPETQPVWNDASYNLGEGHFSSEINWNTAYGELYDGHFRLGKTLTVDGAVCTYYGEFYIMDNDPRKEPEVKQTVDRIHAAIDEIMARDCVHVVRIYDGTSEAGGEGSGQTDMMWSGTDYIQDVWDENLYGSGGNQSARYNGVSYRENEGRWYNAGEAEFFFEGNGWDYSQRLNGHHVTVDSVTDEKISLILDSESDGMFSRIYRDYYFDDQGRLSQIESTTYYRSRGQLYKAHNVTEIYPEEKSTLITKLEAVVSNAGNHTYEDYEQIMREKEFDTNFELGSASFVWRQKDWSYRISGEEGSATATGIMLYHEYGASGSQGNLYTQGAFWIERFEDGKWSRVSVPAGNPLPSDEAKLIFDNTNGLTAPTRMRCDWSDSYGTLEPGFYRVAQNYKLTTTSGEENIKTCYAKFRVYDPNMELYLAEARQGLADLLNRESYYIEIMKDYYGFEQGEEGKLHDIRRENVWKKDNQNFLSTDEPDKFSDYTSYSLLKNGRGYFNSGEPGDGWEQVGHFDRESFEFWHVHFDMYDSSISSVEKKGNVITVNSDLTEYKQQFVYTFDDTGRLVEGQCYNLMEEEPVLTDEFKVKDVTEVELESVFSKYDITKPAIFSYEEDAKLFANYDNWQTSGFNNTNPVTLSSAQEAEERAKNDCTLLPWEDENGIHEGGWNLTKAFFDTDAQMWKVEFTFSQGGVYQAVYMTADGITVCVVS